MGELKSFEITRLGHMERDVTVQQHIQVDVMRGKTEGDIVVALGVVGREGGRGSVDLTADDCLALEKRLRECRAVLLRGERDDLSFLGPSAPEGRPPDNAPTVPEREESFILIGPFDGDKQAGRAISELGWGQPLFAVMDAAKQWIAVETRHHAPYPLETAEQYEKRRHAAGASLDAMIERVAGSPEEQLLSTTSGQTPDGFEMGQRRSQPTDD